MKKKPTDATLRNVRAANKKLVEHAHWIGELRAKLEDVEDRIRAIEAPLISVEPPTETVPGEPWR